MAMVVICVADRHDVRLFPLLVENVDSLIEGWFQNQVKSVYVLCPHCMKAHRHPPTIFSLKDIRLAVTQGKQHMSCHDTLLSIGIPLPLAFRS